MPNVGAITASSRYTAGYVFTGDAHQLPLKPSSVVLTSDGSGTRYQVALKVALSDLRPALPAGRTVTSVKLPAPFGVDSAAASFTTNGKGSAAVLDVSSDVTSPSSWTQKQMPPWLALQLDDGSVRKVFLNAPAITVDRQAYGTAIARGNLDNLRQQANQLRASFDTLQAQKANPSVLPEARALPEKQTAIDTAVAAREATRTRITQALAGLKQSALGDAVSWATRATPDDAGIHASAESLAAASRTIASLAPIRAQFAGLVADYEAEGQGSSEAAVAARAQVAELDAKLMPAQKQSDEAAAAIATWLSAGKASDAVLEHAATAMPGEKSQPTLTLLRLDESLARFRLVEAKTAYNFAVKTVDSSLQWTAGKLQALPAQIAAAQKSLDLATATSERTVVSVR